MNENLWIKKQSKLETEDKTHWAKLRIKKDSRKNDDYIDILMGKRGKSWHAHYGFNLDQSIRFTEFRGVVHSIKREIDSKIIGHLETKKYVVDPNLKPGKNLILKLDIEEETNEVKISVFRLE